MRIPKPLQRFYRKIIYERFNIIGYLAILISILYFSGVIHVLSEVSPPLVNLPSGRASVFSYQLSMQTQTETIIVLSIIILGILSIWAIYNIASRTFYISNPSLAMIVFPILLLTIFLVLLYVSYATVTGGI